MVLVFVSPSFEPSRISKTSSIASRLRQTAFTDSACADHLVFERLRSINAFSISSSLSFNSLLRLVLLVKKTKILSKVANVLPTNDDSWQPCSITRLMPCGTHLVYGILRSRISVNFCCVPL